MYNGVRHLRTISYRRLLWFNVIGSCGVDGETQADTEHGRVKYSTVTTHNVFVTGLAMTGASRVRTGQEPYPVFPGVTGAERENRVNT